MKRDIRDRGKVSIGLEKGGYGKKIESSLMNCFLRIISVFSFIFKLKVARALKFSLPALLMMIVGVGIVIGGSVIVKNGELNVSNDMSVSNDVLYVDSVNNRVGIGTTIPNWELDVTGDIRATGAICDSTGCIGIGLWTDQGSYIYPDNYNQFVITDTGYVGIGTATPQDKLDIRGDLLIPVQDITVDCNGILVGAGTCDIISDGTVLVSVGLDTLDFNGDNLADGSPLCTDSLSAPTIVARDDINGCSDGAILGMSILGTPDGSETITVTSVWAFKDDDSDGLLDNGEDLYIDNNPTTEYFSSGTGNAYFGGNVGIGTTSPEAKLDVDGSLVVRDELPFPSSGNGVRVGWDDAWNRGFIQAYDWDVNQYREMLVEGNIVALYSGQPATESIRIDENGNVGIGTTSPSAKLQVTDDDGNIKMILSSLNVPGGWISRSWEFYAEPNYLLIAGDFTLPRKGLAIDLHGNVGIGTTTPSEKLDVGGNIRASNLAGIGNRCVYVDLNGVLRTKAADCGTVISADNLGNHIATQNIQLGTNWLSGDGGSEGVSVDSVGNVQISGSLTASSLNGNGAGITNLDAGNLAVGIVPSGRLSGTYSIDITGNAVTATTANSGDSATAFFSSGTIEDARLSFTLADAVSDGSCTGCIAETAIAQNTLDDSEIQDNSLTAISLAVNSVGASEIAAGAVGSSEVADNSLTASDLAAGSVGTSEVALNSLTAVDLAANSVGASEIAAGAVGSSEVADNSLTAVDLAANSVGASEIAANVVGDSELMNGGTWTTTSDLAITGGGGVNAFSVDGTTFSVDALNNRVGIGTTNPAYKLEVVGGPIKATGGLIIQTTVPSSPVNGQMWLI